MRRIITILAMLCFVSLGTTGCKSFAEFSAEMVDTGVELTEGLEETGAQYSVAIHIPGEIDADWSPFGCEAGIPGAYLDARVWSSGLGGGPDAPGVPPAPTATDDLPGASPPDEE